MSKKPDARQIKLVRGVATALEQFHGERPGNIACHLQAAQLLINAGVLEGFDPIDFVEVRKYTPEA